MQVSATIQLKDDRHGLRELRLRSSSREGLHRKIDDCSAQMGSLEDNTSGGSYAYRASKAALNAGTRSSFALHAHFLCSPCFMLKPARCTPTSIGNPLMGASVRSCSDKVSFNGPGRRGDYSRPAAPRSDCSLLLS